MRLEWSAAALVDFERFSDFLHRHHPDLAAIVAREVISKAKLLEEQPSLGRSLGNRGDYREVVLRVLNAAYVFQYRYDGQRLVLLRVFHGREERD
jgi:plasmid stabilization system protein ParE